MLTREVKTTRVVCEEIVNYAGITLVNTTLVDTDATMAADSDTRVPSQKAVAAFVAAAVSDITPTEANFLDGAQAGTQVASKAVVADANVNIGVTKVTELHIGATGAETQVTATGAEINVLAGVTPGTNAASKAVVAGADGKVGALTFDGAVTTEVDPLTTAGVGAKNGATVAVVEKGDGVLHKTILTCTATPLTFGDEAGQGQYGGVKIYDFPAGLVTVFGGVVDGELTLTAPAIDTWEGDIGLGVEAPTDHQDVANKTGLVMQKNDIAAAVAKVGQIEAKSVATALTESGARWLDGTGTAKDLFLNILIDDNGAHDNTITGTFTGTVTILWANIGDIA